MVHLHIFKTSIQQQMGGKGSNAGGTTTEREPTVSNGGQTPVGGTPKNIVNFVKNPLQLKLSGGKKVDDNSGGSSQLKITIITSYPCAQ